METLQVDTRPHRTFLNREGQGSPILFIHGSGPGANAFSNWQLALPEFSRKFLALAPDLVGFGQSAHPDPPPQGMRAWMRAWVNQLLGLLDALGLEKTHLVGNSLGGAVALHLLMEAPGRFDKVVLMGPVGAPLQITPELDRIWGFYEDPTLSALRNAIRWFAYDEGFVADRLEQIAQTRLESALKPEVRRSFEAMWPAPRQQHLDSLVLPDSALRRIAHPVLLIHGRDDRIVPLQTSLHLLERLQKAHLVAVGQCSHWVQIEQARVFHRLVWDFLQGEF